MDADATMSMAVAVMLDRSRVYTFCSGVVRRIRQQTTNDNNNNEEEKGEKDREKKNQSTPFVNNTCESCYCACAVW